MFTPASASNSKPPHLDSVGVQPFGRCTSRHFALSLLLGLLLLSLGRGAPVNPLQGIHTARESGDYEGALDLLNRFETSQPELFALNNLDYLKARLLIDSGRIETGIALLAALDWRESLLGDSILVPCWRERPTRCPRHGARTFLPFSRTTRDIRPGRAGPSPTQTLSRNTTRSSRPWNGMTGSGGPAPAHLLVEQHSNMLDRTCPETTRQRRSGISRISSRKAPKMTWLCRPCSTCMTCFLSPNRPSPEYASGSTSWSPTAVPRWPGTTSITFWKVSAQPLCSPVPISCGQKLRF